MNSTLTSPGKNGNDTFIIADYLELLTKSDKNKTKYICPVCEGHNLSIAKNGKKYTCYDNCTGKQIAYKLRELNGEFKGKEQKSSNDLSQVYKPDKTRKKQESKRTTEPRKLSSNTEAIDYIKVLWGDKLRFNLRSLEIELNGQKLNPDTIHTTLAEQERIDITKERAIDITFHLAIKQEYDPVKDYFESIKGLKSSFPKKAISTYLFGIEDSYYDELIWLFLLGVVKRVYEPGCKFDYAFVLQGEQGLGKSSFFRALIPDSFSDNMSSRLAVDDLRIMNAHAINEWGELGNFTAKQYEDVIKAFLSRQEDQFRLPYAKALLTYPRRSVIVGTVNEGQFLTDITGNRRFMVVPVTRIMLPLDVATIRNEIWAAVIEDYLENWQGPLNELGLSDESKARQKAENENFKNSDILEEAIAACIDGRENVFLTMAEITSYLVEWNNHVLGLRASDKGIQMRIAKILNHLGWTKKLKRVGTKPQRVWIHRSQK